MCPCGSDRRYQLYAYSLIEKLLIYSIALELFIFDPISIGNFINNK